MQIDHDSCNLGHQSCRILRRRQLVGIGLFEIATGNMFEDQVRASVVDAHVKDANQARMIEVSQHPAFCQQRVQLTSIVTRFAM